MKKLVIFFSLFVFVQLAAFAQGPVSQIAGKVVYNGEDVVFHQIDEHTDTKYEVIYNRFSIELDMWRSIGKL